jgi:hypothetical protein
VSANPPQIAGVLCTGCGAGSTDREASTTLTIRETGGADITLSAVEMTLRDQSNAVIASGTFDAAAIAQIAGSTRIAAGGSVTMAAGVHYPGSNVGRTGTLTYIVRATDARGTQISQTLAVPATM